MPAHRDGFRDGQVLEAAAPDQLRWDERPPGPGESDAWDDAHRDATVDAALLRRALPAVDAEKLAARVQGVRVQVADRQRSGHLIAQSERQGEAVPYIPDVVPSGARSSVAQGSAAQGSAAQVDAEELPL